jgi:hypothetical protein
MSLLRGLGLAILLMACCPWCTSQAGVYVGLGYGGPFYRPYYRPFYRPYYGVGFGFYPGYVVPPPVVVQPAPIVVQQPAVIQPAYAPPAQAPAPAPAPLPPPTPDTAYAPPPPSPVMPAVATSAGSNRQADIDACLRQLRAGDEQSRADALVRLGRLRAEGATGPMIKALNSDGSAKVREAAARGLGLLADPNTLSALQYAAQADDNGDVRHSASFAAEVIRGNLRR